MFSLFLFLIAVGGGVHLEVGWAVRGAITGGRVCSAHLTICLTA